MVNIALGKNNQSPVTGRESSAAAFKNTTQDKERVIVAAVAAPPAAKGINMEAALSELGGIFTLPQKNKEQHLRVFTQWERKVFLHYC